MVVKKYILSNLTILNTKFNRSKTPKDELFYSKLAIIELCGWIEESVDDIFDACSKKYLTETRHLSVMTKAMEKTWGLHYDRNFRELFIRLIGIINFERIEKGMDPHKLSQLSSTLNNLTLARNPHAHTHLRGVTVAINAPTVTISHFNSVYEGLKEFERVLKLQKL